MKAIIIKVSNERKSRHGGIYKRAIFKNISDDSKGEQFIFDCYYEHTKSRRFLPYLKNQAIFDNLNTIEYNNKTVINGNCNFTYLGQRC